jgi:hypothetical protein
MKFIRTYEMWNTTTTINDVEPQYDFVSKGKTYYGVHKIHLIRDDKRVQVKAKFDTGARTSSIDFSVAQKLGISKELLDECKRLDHLDISKDITRTEQRELEKKYTEELKEKFPDEVTSVQISKSSSGFSIRSYIRCKIEYFGNIVDTEVNLRDRTGMSCEMLVGLKDML